jgi:hypothetical protein
MFKMKAAAFFVMLVTVKLDGVTSQKTAIPNSENAPEFDTNFICYWLAHRIFISSYDMTLAVIIDAITWHYYRKPITLMAFLLPSFYYGTLGI